MASFPQMDLPFLPYGKAMSARRQLLDIFDRDMAAARAAAAEGRPVAGQLGIMISALDEDGNTCVRARVCVGGWDEGGVRLGAHACMSMVASVCVHTCSCTRKRVSSWFACVMSWIPG
jgi:hypothetical protein